MHQGPQLGLPRGAGAGTEPCGLTGSECVSEGLSSAARRPVMERKAGLRRQRKLSGALLSLSRSVQELTEENQSLKEDLDRVLSSSPTVARTKGTPSPTPARPPGRTCHWAAS